MDIRNDIFTGHDVFGDIQKLHSFSFALYADDIILFLTNLKVSIPQLCGMWTRKLVACLALEKLTYIVKRKKRKNKALLTY